MVENRFAYLRGHTIEDGRIVSVSSVAKRNLENQQRLENERLGIVKVRGMVDGKRTIARTRREIIGR